MSATKRSDPVRALARASATTLLFSLLAGCRTESPERGPARGEPGRLKVLLAAEPVSGVEVLLRVEAVEVETPDARTITLFAGPATWLSSSDLAREPAVLGEAALEAGLYRAIALRIAEAHRDEGASRAALSVVSEPVWVRGAFRVTAGGEASVVLSLDLARSLQSAGNFVPVLESRATQRRPRRSLFLVALERASQVVVLDRSDGERLASVATGCPPGGIAISPDRRRLFVAEPDLDSVAQVDLATFAILDRTRIPFGSRPRDVAVPAGGRLVFVTCEGTNEVFVFDARTLGRVASLDAGRGPNRIETDPFGERVYVLSPIRRELRVFDARTPRLASRVALDPDPVALAFSADGARYLVAHHAGEAVLAFDRRTDAPVGRTVVGPGSVDITSDPFSNRLYVLQDSPPRLLYLDAMTLALTRSVALPSAPRRAACDPDSASLFVALRDRKEVLVIDRIGGRIEGTFPVDEAGADVVVVP